MANLIPQDDYIRTALRLPRDLHAQVQASAETKGRSMNAEIISRLQDSFSKDDSRLVIALEEQIGTYKYWLEKARGIISMALLRGRQGKIPDADFKWMSEDLNEIARLSKSRSCVPNETP